MKTEFNAGQEQFVTTGNGGGRLVYGLEGLSDEIVRMLACHGLKQKVGDAGAIPRDTATGKSATDEEKLEAMARVWESLRAGEWSIRAGGGDGSGSDGLLVRALIRLYPGQTPEAIREKVAAMDKAKQAALRVSAKVAPTIAEIKAEDDARKARGSRVDAESLLAAFE